jgi:hypothetical protein
MKIEQAELDRMLRAADIVEIQMIQGKYMSLLDQDDFTAIYELFDKDNPEITYEMVEGGEYRKARVRDLVVGEKSKLADKEEKRGWVGLQYLWTPKIVISEDGTKAIGQWGQFSPHGMPVSPYPGNAHRQTAYWYMGRYDNEYIKTDGVWKILKCHICAFVRTPYDEGWLKQQDCRRMYHAGSGAPDSPSRVYTYHPDAVYTPEGEGAYNWGPYMSFEPF